LENNGVPKKIKVNVEIDAKAEEIKADPDCIRRIASNLTLNAIQAILTAVN
jgi:signal transduction histidine kinase